MKNKDYEKFINTPISVLDFTFMVSDLIDFLNFSESNISWQKRSEIQSIERRFERNEINDEDRYHLIENVNYRFDVSLTLQLRYAALISLVTSVEWAVSVIALKITEKIPKEPREKNKTVFILEHINSLSGSSQDEEIRNFEDLVKVRNSIAHSSGIEKYAKYPQQLSEAVNRLCGFSLEEWNFLGVHVCILKDSIEKYANEIERSIIKIYIALGESNYLKKQT